MAETVMELRCLTTCNAMLSSKENGEGDWEGRKDALSASPDDTVTVWAEKKMSMRKSPNQMVS